MHIYCQTTPILKTYGQFENLVFVIMSTRENIRLIARTSLVWFGIKSDLSFLKGTVTLMITIVLYEGT